MLIIVFLACGLQAFNPSEFYFLAIEVCEETVIMRVKIVRINGQAAGWIHLGSEAA